MNKPNQAQELCDILLGFTQNPYPLSPDEIKQLFAAIMPVIMELDARVAALEGERDGPIKPEIE